MSVEACRCENLLGQMVQGSSTSFFSTMAFLQAGSFSIWAAMALTTTSVGSLEGVQIKTLYPASLVARKGTIICTIECVFPVPGGPVTIPIPSGKARH